MIVALSIMTTALSACAQGPHIEIVGPDGARRAAVSVEIADTPARREYGLMYRKQMDEDAGMIFVFTAPKHQTFWMKNTIIPLDMIFADGSGKIIGVVRKAEPFSEAIDAVRWRFSICARGQRRLLRSPRGQSRAICSISRASSRMPPTDSDGSGRARSIGMAGVPGEGADHAEE